MLKRENKRLRFFRAIGFWISVILSLLIASIYVLSRPEIGLIPGSGILDIIEAKTLDMRFHWRGERQPGNDIVIIGVDEKTDDELGRWWSSGRLWIAKMLDILKEGGAKVVGFDLVLSQPEETTALVAVNEIKTRLLENVPGGDIDYTKIFTYLDEIKANYDYDQLLANAIQRFGNVVLGIYHFVNAKEAAHLTPEKQAAYHHIISRVKYTAIKFPPQSTISPLGLTHSFGVEPNLPIFSDVAKSIGHFNALPYRDDYIRQSALLIEYQGEYYPSLALEITRVSLNLSGPPIIHALGKEGIGVVDFIQLGKILIPTDERGRLLINYYGPEKTFPHYSLSDVVLGRIPPQTFKDKIVLLGFTGAGYQDVHSTSFRANNYPGVETHATVIANILRQDFLTRPSVTFLLDALILVLLGIFLGFILHRTSPLAGALTAFICLLGMTGIVYGAFLFQRLWLDMTFPFLFIMLDYIAVTSYKYFTEEKKKKEIKHAFQHYVSPTVVDQMLEKIDQLHLGGERKHLTALFSDIRGFTSISEKMDPEQLSKFLNEYLTAMTKIVLTYEGTVDKYMGDAIMAFYGAPLDQPDHAARACRTAIDMITRLKELQIDWQNRSLPPMNIGIGLNSGEMSVGNMGSEERFNYTIMGDHVNLASRLEGINKQYGTNIVISQFTYQLIQDQPFIARELDSVIVKGKHEPVKIYELIGYGTSDQATQALLQLFNEGLKAYKGRQWEQAIASFQEVLRVRPDDMPSKLYLDRCQEYQKTPPPENWDGSFVMETK